MFAGQDLLTQHSSANGGEMNGSIRLASPLGGQPPGATLTISNEHLLPQSPANTAMAGQAWRHSLHWLSSGIQRTGTGNLMHNTFFPGISYINIQN